MQTINWLERKDYNGENYYDVTLEDGRKARLNEKTKKGEVYPDWENIKPGTTIDDTQLWQSDKGYWYIFPPKQQKPAGTGIKAAQERKTASIAQAQENKEWGIMTSATLRDAVLLAVAENQREAVDLAERVTFWRAWLIENWDIDPKDRKPF